MRLWSSEGAQQRRYLAPVPARQKTVQGELGSAKRDACGEAEILALGIISAGDGGQSLGGDGISECVQVRETTALAAVGQHLGPVFAAQIDGQTFEYDGGGGADIDRRGCNRQGRD